MKIAHLIITMCVISIMVFLFRPMSVYSWSEIKVEGAVSEIYDDNPTFINENEKLDTITNLTLGLAGKYEGKTQILEFMAHINQQIFAENHDFNNMSQDLRLMFSSEFSKYDRIRLENLLIHTDEPRSFEEAFGRIGGRYSYYRNRFNFNYTKDISKQFRIITKYANELNSASREDIKDSYLNKAGFEMDYFPSLATMLLCSYEFANRKFAHSEEASTHTIAVGIRPHITEHVYLDGRIGVDFINPYNDQDYTKQRILASLRSEINRNTGAGLSFSKQYSTVHYYEDIFDYWKTSAFLKTQLLRSLKCYLSGFYAEGEYVSLNIVDKFWGAKIVFTCDLTGKLKGEIGYAYSDSDSTNVTRKYIKNRAFLRLGVEL